MFLYRVCDLCLTHASVIFQIFDLDGDELLSKKEFRKIEMALMQGSGDQSLSPKFQTLIDLFVHCTFVMVRQLVF
jgi:Ca2+-binding EF-hand superfamily protein